MHTYDDHDHLTQPHTHVNMHYMYTSTHTCNMHNQQHGHVHIHTYLTAASHYTRAPSLSSTFPEHPGLPSPAPPSPPRPHAMAGLTMGGLPWGQKGGSLRVSNDAQGNLPLLLGPLSLSLCLALLSLPCLPCPPPHHPPPSWHAKAGPW